MRKLGFLFAALLLGLAVLHARPDRWELPASTENAPLAVSAVTAPRPPDSRASRRIFAAGTIEGASREIPLRFEITGRLLKVHVVEGDEVERGDVLAQLDAETWEHKLAEAQARLQVARAERERIVNGASHESREALRSEVRGFEVQVRQAESQLARGKRLVSQNAVAVQEVDDQKYRYERAVAQLQAARARLDELEAPVRKDDLSIADSKVALAEALVRQEQSLLEKTRLRAPTRGIVLHVPAEVGELVGPADQHELVTLVNRDRTRVRAHIEELDALHVRPGQRAEVTVDGCPGKEYPGVVLRCSPFVRPKTQKHLKPGELVDLRVREVVIDLGEDAKELVVGLPVEVFIKPSESAGKHQMLGSPDTSPVSAVPSHNSGIGNDFGLFSYFQ